MNDILMKVLYTGKPVVTRKNRYSLTKVVIKNKIYGIVLKCEKRHINTRDEYRYTKVACIRECKLNAFNE